MNFTKHIATAFIIHYNRNKKSIKKETDNNELE